MIVRICVVLKTLVALNSVDMITSLTSMTSTASFAPENKTKQHALYILNDFLGIKNLSGLTDINSLNNLAGFNDLFSLIASKKDTELDVSINPGA